MMLVLIRHGRADGNRDHRFIGQSDVPLDDEGRRQAEAIAARLADVGIERVVSSDLRRTADTAAPLARLLGVDVDVEPRLREIANGEWTGLLPEAIRAGWPDLWASYTEGADVPRPKGERWADVRGRVVPALEGLLASGRTTAVFTHGGPIVVAAAWASGVSLPGNVFRGGVAPPANGAITTIVEGPRLLGYNDVGHLASLAGLDVPFAPVGGE